MIPKTLASNSGFDLTDTIVKLEEEHEKGNIVGLDVTTGEPMNPADVGVYDCVCGGAWLSFWPFSLRLLVPLSVVGLDCH